MTERRPVLVVHGGAGTHAAIAGCPEARKAVEEGVVQAARRGYDELRKGGSSLDAVEAAVMSLEDNATFNAGIYLILINTCSGKHDFCENSYSCITLRTVLDYHIEVHHIVIKMQEIYV